MRERVFFGWWVILGASCTLFVCGGIGFGSLPVFLKFIDADMQWGRDSLSNAGAIAALAAGFTAPMIGYVIDRHSVRAVMLPGALLLSAAFFLLSRIESISQLYALYLATGVGMAATTILPSQTLASRWFAQKRGRAMGIVTAAGGLGGMIWMPVTNYLIETMGWRGAYAVLGACIAVVSVPFIWLTVRNSPQSMGLTVDGWPDPVPEGQASRNAATDPDLGGTDYSVRDAFGTLSLWLIFFAIFMVSFAASGFGLHIIAFLSDAGLSPGTATFSWSLTIGVSIGGRFLFGYLSEQYQKRYFAAAANVARAVSLVLLVLFALKMIPQSAAVIQLVIIYGLAVGCNNVLNPLLVGETFGVESFGRLMGLMGIPFTIGMALGQVTAGHLYEFWDNYNIAFSAFALAFILSGIAISFAKPHFLLNARRAAGEAQS